MQAMQTRNDEPLSWWARVRRRAATWLDPAHDVSIRLRLRLDSDQVEDEMDAVYARVEDVLRQRRQVVPDDADRDAACGNDGRCGCLTDDDTGDTDDAGDRAGS